MRAASAASGNKRPPAVGSASSNSSSGDLAAAVGSPAKSPWLNIQPQLGACGHERHLRRVEEVAYQQFSPAESWQSKNQQGPSSSSSQVDCDEQRKQSHCEIEKRRRDKMNHYIMELASVIPSFNNNPSKFDKLTILRMAVQHVKSLRSSLCSFSSFHLRPSFLSSGNLLKNLILQMASQEARDNLFMVVTCDRAKVLFVSESSRDILNQDQHELVGQCLFDFLHKDDISKVKEQILHFNVVPREMLVDSKTLQPIKMNHQQRHQSFSQTKGKSSSTPQPGARRSFFCRMRSGSASQQTGSVDASLNDPLSVLKTTTQVPSSDLNHSNACTTESTLNTAATTTTNITNTAKRRNYQEDSDNQTGSGGNSSSTSSSSDANNKNGSSSGIGSGSGTSSSSGEQSAGSSASSGHLTKKLTHHSNYRGHKRKNLRYIVMHCTGYLKSITMKNDEFEEDDYESCNSDNNQSEEDESYSWRTINCLVVVCRRSPFDRDLKPDRPLTFTCRYSMDGKFMFVDQRTTMALGYTPQQLLGTSHYAYCHKDSVNTFKECHRQSILKSEPVSSDIYQFKRSNGQNLWLQTSLKSFRNPWTKFIDYIIASHTTAEGNDRHYNEGCVPTKFNQDMSGDGSQSSSPSSSLSIPSTDGKKSTESTCSSSMASSYSLESYSSGGNIQALLSRIDRVKPISGASIIVGGDAKKKRSSNNNNNNSSDDNNQLTPSSSSSSTRKSRNDTGNFSDLQSCSSQSSQNSAGEFRMNRNSSLTCFNVASDIGHETASTNQVTDQPATNTSITIPMNPTEPNTPYYQQESQKLNTVFPYAVQDMCISEPPPPPPQCHQMIQMARAQQEAPESMQQVSATCSRPQISSKLHQPYVIQSVVAGCPMSVIPTATTQQQQQIQPQPIGVRGGPHQHISSVGSDRYPVEMVPINDYPVQANVNPLYKMDVTSLTQHRIQRAPMTVVGSMVAPQQQIIQAQQGPMNVSPMLWNSSTPIIQQQQAIPPGSSYHQPMDGPQQQMCHQVMSSSNLISMTALNEPQHLLQTGQQHQHQQPQPIQCQQCANHKCSMQPSVTISNSTDLSDITSLAVDEELDEEQLLEYLAGCDSGPQLYYTQNNAFP